MADRKEHSGRFERRGLVVLNISNPHSGHSDTRILIAKYLVDYRELDQLDLRIGKRSLLHDLARTHLAAPQNQIDLRGILGQITCLFNGRVSPSDDHQRLVAKSRKRSVAYRASTNTTIAKLLFARYPQIIRTRPRRKNHRAGLERSIFAGVQNHRLLGKIDADNIVGDHSGAEVRGLLTHQFHQLRTGNRMRMLLDRGVHVLTARVDGRVDELLELARWKPRIVFNLGRLSKLAHREASHDPILFGHGSLEKQWTKVRSRRIDRSRPACRSTPDDDAIFDVAHE